MEKECPHCHKTFEVQRIDSLYCSRSCRQMAYMERKMERLKSENLQGIGEMSEGHIANLPEIKKETDTTEPIALPIHKKIEAPVKEEEYVPAPSIFLDTIRQRIDDDSNMSAMNTCIRIHQDIHSYWIGLRLRCLIECLLLFSECKYTKVADLMEICNALTLMQRSIHYQSLPDVFPYIETMRGLREKLKRLCIKAHKAEQIKFRLEQKDKIEMVAMRYELAQFIPKKKFNQLDFE
jgi:hypothetical protein